MFGFTRLLYSSIKQQIYTIFLFLFHLNFIPPTPRPQPNGSGGDFILRYKSCLAGVLNNNNKYIFHGGGWGIPAAGGSKTRAKKEGQIIDASRIFKTELNTPAGGRGGGWFMRVGCGVWWHRWKFWARPPTLQRKSNLCIPRNGIARPQSQFPHSRSA